MIMDDVKLNGLLEDLHKHERTLDGFESALNEGLLHESAEYKSAWEAYNGCCEAIYSHIKENYPEVSHESITNILFGDMTLQEALEEAR